jgi:hypothetical protein
MSAPPEKEGPPVRCRVSDRFEGRWASGGRPRIEAFLRRARGPARALLLGELLLLELYYRRRQGEPFSAEEYRRRFPEHIQLVNAVFAAVSLPPSQPARSPGSRPP